MERMKLSPILSIIIFKIQLSYFHYLRRLITNIEINGYFRVLFFFLSRFKFFPFRLSELEKDVTTFVIVDFKNRPRKVIFNVDLSGWASGKVDWLVLFERANDVACVYCRTEMRLGSTIRT